MSEPGVCIGAVFQPRPTDNGRSSTVERTAAAPAARADRRSRNQRRPGPTAPDFQQSARQHHPAHAARGKGDYPLTLRQRSSGNLSDQHPDTASRRTTWSESSTGSGAVTPRASGRPTERPRTVDRPAAHRGVRRPRHCCQRARLRKHIHHAPADGHRA